MSREIEEIKIRLDIVDLVSEYLPLKQAGTNWKAPCPFHSEKTPSFMVSKEKQIWHCFGCNEGGDIFSFVQKMEGLDFPETLRLLAGKAGVKIEQQDPKVSSQKNRLLDITALAASFWHKTLLESKQAQGARDYLKKRNISDQAIEKFKLGYAIESWDTLIKFLKSRGYLDNEIFLAGLSVKKDRGQGFYDRFRDRIIFPISDAHSSPVGFSARTLKDSEGAKYINTPQTLIYNKSLVLYNLDKAKQEIKKNNFTVVVEGQMDVIAVSMVGTENVVGVSGTAFTLDQLKILKRYSSNLAISFDTDIAGQSAAKRSIDLALSEDMNVKVIVLPNGKDPDDCIKSNKADWFEAVKNAKSIMEYYFDQVKGRVDLKTVEGKKEAAKTLLPVISKINNKIEQTHWLQELSYILNVSEEILRNSLPGQKNKEKPKDSKKSEVSSHVVVKTRQEVLSESILAILLKFPGFLADFSNDIEIDTLVPENVNSLYKELVIYYTKTINGQIEDFEYSDFEAKIKDSNLKGLADTLILLAEKDFFDLDIAEVRLEIRKMISSLNKGYLSEKLKQIELEIKIAEKADDKNEIEKLLQESSKIISKINSLD